MGWTETARREHDRSGLRYASDCTDEEWAVVRPLLRRTSRVGRPRKHKARTLWDAIQYIASTGCQRAQLPKDFPPFTTVQYHFYRMRDNGLLDVINAVLIAWVRVSEGRTMMPTAGVIDNQSVKTTEAGGPRGYDAGKKIKGRKRHIVTDTLGNMLEGVVHGADVQDRDGAPGLIERSCDAYPTLTRLFADGGYAGQKLEGAVAHIDRLTIEIIRRSDLKGFVVLPRRWVVERTLAWLNRCRRLAKDWEASIASSEAWIVVSSIRRMTRRIAKSNYEPGSEASSSLHFPGRPTWHLHAHAIRRVVSAITALDISTGQPTGGAAHCLRVPTSSFVNLLARRSSMS